jgi:curved DNA-binding protein CbpA
MDPYTVLEVKRGSTKKQIKAAYRKLSRETHPDLNPNLPDMEFKLVNWAYRAITNPVKAGQCPYKQPKVKTTVKQTPTGTSYKKRAEKRKKPKPPPDPNWGAKDHTLKYYNYGPDGYYDEQREHIFTAAPPPPRKRRKARRTEYRASGPRRATASVEEIIDDAPQSEWQKKWAKKMKERCNIV